MRVRRPSSLDTSIALIGGFLALLIPNPRGAAFGQEQTTESSDVVTPSNVYATMDALTTAVDLILDAKQIPVPPPRKCLESGLGPFHVHQFQLACVERLHTLQRQAGMSPIPLVVSTPMKYSWADVKKITDLMASEVWKFGSALEIEGLPDKLDTFSEKTPADVAEITLNLFAKLSAMSGQEKISPNEVFAQVVRAGADAEAILKQIDPACRYRVNPPASKPGRKPSDVFAKCLEVRHAINKLRESMKLSATPVPSMSADRKLQPADVFIQTQIIIAELNLLKMNTGTISSTPLAIPVSDKTPTNVHEQVALLQYLLPQVRSLRNMVAQAKTK